MDGSTAPPSLAQLAEQVGTSPYHLQRVFKRIMGLTPHQYADACRWKNLKANLKNGQSVTHALYEAGYGSSSRLYEPASSQMGMTPGAYRRGGAGLRMTYTVLTSPLGWVLIAATQRGVCAVSLGDHEEALEEGLRGEFPQAEIQRDDEALGKWAHDVVEHLTNRVPSVDVPLDIRATAFQRLVWEELQRIPRGETRSYSQIARTIGRPKAARAVAHACSKNPVAVVIPCHRVLREDGSLGGYRWGLARKQALIAQERGLSTGP
jgi:AraC family transcriptional regulator of adaptative response/methylated-DNA-[protein]-cysteine methyltransferase